MLDALYVVGDDRFYPAHVRREDGALRTVLRPLHRVPVTRRASVDDAKPEEFTALLAACEHWRDRFLLAVMYFAGLRLGRDDRPAPVGSAFRRALGRAWLLVSGRASARRAARERQRRAREERAGADRAGGGAAGRRV